MATLTVELPSQRTQTVFNLRRWAELQADPVLGRIEGRVETDRHGHIIMSQPKPHEPEFSRGDAEARRDRVRPAASGRLRLSLAHRWVPAWLLLTLLTLLTSAWLTPAGAAMPSARLVKVLPHFVDKQGRIALSPSLYERDAYQAQLRKNPAEQGGMRFDVQWKSSATNRFALRLELRGNKENVGTSLVLEQTVKYTGFFSTWSRIPVTSEAQARLGELSAWRATLWDGPRMIAEQKSFLW